MSIRLTSNHLFNGRDFLDARQGLAKNLNDLRDWIHSDIIIPKGFEVCVDGEWYTFLGTEDEDNWNELTGYFRKRVNPESGNGGNVNPNVPTQGAVFEGKIIGSVIMETDINRIDFSTIDKNTENSDINTQEPN